MDPIEYSIQKIDGTIRIILRSFLINNTRVSFLFKCEDKKQMSISNSLYIDNDFILSLKNTETDVDVNLKMAKQAVPSNKIVLLYLDSGYEKDYIVEVLLRPNFAIVHELFTKFSSLQTSYFENIRDISKNNNAKLVFVFSSNSLSDVKVLEQILDIIEPTVVVHNSDEYGERESILRMSYKTKLFLTQYGYYHSFNMMLEIASKKI